MEPSGSSQAATGLDVRSLASIPEGTWLPPGTVSADDVSVVGHENWLFLYRGSNDYYAAYQEPARSEARQDALAWKLYIAKWRDSIARQGRRFQAVIVPNKASVLPEYYPLPLASALTWRMRHLLELVDGDFLYPLADIGNAGLREVLFRRNDSHLSDAGNIFLSNLILRALGVEEPLVPCVEDRMEIRSLSHFGDLGRRFDPPCSERVFRVARDLAHLTITELAEPVSRSGFVGLSYRTENPRAPLKKSLLVFGNSFFEKVPSWGMAPDFSLAFERVTFVWSEKIDQSLIEESDADCVLLQTCERFLGRRPEQG